MEKNKSKRRLETFSSLPHKRRGKALEGSGTKRVQLGWLHYSDKQKRYVAVRQNKGGGTRDICDPPRDFSHFGDDMRTTRSHSKTKDAGVIKERLC